MSFMKYHAILDDGRRCQSCCNRCNIFGSRDIVSGWLGDCRECNSRWYRHQLRCVSRGFQHMVAARNFWKLGAAATLTISRCVEFDLNWSRAVESWHRKVIMLKEVLTNVVDSDDEFDSEEMAVQTYPLTGLATICPCSKTLLRELRRSSPFREVSILDVVVSYLMGQPNLDHLTHDAIATIQHHDYVLEHEWEKYQWNNREWFYNFTTEEGFWKDEPAPWTAYRYRNNVWWLNGRRWFWE